MKWQCTLCETPVDKIFFESQTRLYGLRQFIQCPNCQLIFLNPEHCVSLEQEKKIYDQHENSPDNKGYCDFLNKLLDPLSKLLNPGSQGLDFGSGPGPTLSVLMKEKGFEMDLYDPIYHPDKTALQKQYDFVTATEVVEHFQNPKEGFEQLFGLLKPGGILGIMTQTVPEDKPFADWWYHRDPTHVSLFSEATVDWVGGKFSRQIYRHNGAYIFTE